MRIGFDAKRFFNNPTGLGQYSRFIVRALCNHYPENSYWLYTPNRRHHASLSTMNEYDGAMNIRTPPKSITSLKMNSYWRSVLLGRVADKDHMDIFHGLSNELPWIKTRKTKTVVTIHDLIVKRYPKLYHPIDVKIYSLKLARACKIADIIIAISHQTKQDICEYLHVDKSKIRVIRQGYNALFEKKEITDEEITEIKTRRSLPHEFILTVGTIEHRKNALLIIKALTQLHRNIPLLVVGKPTKYMSVLNDYITRNNLTHDVLFIHDAKPWELVILYRLAKLFIYPSFYEGFGIPIIEAISSGIPIIASNIPCFVETGGPHICLVDPHDEKALAEAIENILSDESKQKEMVEKSKKYLLPYEPSRVAKSLMKVYRELV